MSNKSKHAEHMAMNEKAWDAYQAFYNERLGPTYPEDAFAGGQVHLDETEVRLAGDVTGQVVLDVCCASYADEVFSWENLGAKAIGCDLSPTAVAIARQNAVRLNSRAEFFVCDSQELAPIASESIDMVYGHYLCWFEDIERTLQSWFRVTRPGGRLLISQTHPITTWVLEVEGDSYRVARKYYDESPEYGIFTGTPAAEGRWRGPYHPVVEFFHPTWRIVNAALEAGYQLLRMEEACEADEGRRPDLPNQLYLLARKPEAEEGP